MRVTGTRAYPGATAGHILGKILQVLVVFNVDDQHPLCTAGLWSLSSRLWLTYQLCYRLAVLGDDHFLARAECPDEVRQCRLGFFHADGAEHHLPPYSYVNIFGCAVLKKDM
jgi:hypothetical protein